MRVIETKLKGVLIIEPDIFRDTRGYFMETWNQDRYAQAGLPTKFVQDNLSFSINGVLRGLHFQYPSAQDKLVYVVEGEVFDVAVDIRLGSPTFAQWVGLTLSGENGRQLFIPKDFAHGFCVTSKTATFAYKCTEFYNQNTERGIIWNDPGIGIEWPIDTPLLSVKDSTYLKLQDIPYDQLPKYGGYKS